jgi:hypothetical protein
MRNPEPEPDLNAVIDRLTKEVTQVRNVIREVEFILSSDPEFQGLPVVGGVRTILRRYKEEQAKNHTKAKY